MASIRMRTLQYVLALALSTPVVAVAHPGVGIVVNRAGDVFYTDLTHVWRITPQGRRSIVVRDVHTHELLIDADDNLFGEDNEYLGGDRWRHRVWRRAPDGRVTDVVPWTNSFWQEFGLVRGRDGTSYWMTCPERRCTIRQRTPRGRVSVVGPRLRFDNQLRGMAPGPDGSLYVIDGSDVRRISRDGQLRTTAANVGSGLMGMFLDRHDHLYVAAWNDRAVLRIAPSGRVGRVATSPAPWGPSGVTVAPDGTLWLLETSTTNAVRVRRIAPSGRVTIFDG